MVRKTPAITRGLATRVLFCALIWAVGTASNQFTSDPGLGLLRVAPILAGVAGMWVFQEFVRAPRKLWTYFIALLAWTSLGFPFALLIRVAMGACIVAQHCVGRCTRRGHRLHVCAYVDYRWRSLDHDLFNGLVLEDALTGVSSAANLSSASKLPGQ